MLDRDAVIKILKSNKKTKDKVVTIVQKHRKTKRFTQKDIAEMLEKYLDGVSTLELSKEYNTSKSTVLQSMKKYADENNRLDEYLDKTASNSMINKRRLFYANKYKF